MTKLLTIYEQEKLRTSDNLSSFIGNNYMRSLTTIVMLIFRNVIFKRTFPEIKSENIKI